MQTEYEKMTELRSRGYIHLHNNWLPVTKEAVRETLVYIMDRWENEFSQKYGGELEIDGFEKSEEDNLYGYYACAFHDEPKDGCDSWSEVIAELPPLGVSGYIEEECKNLGIPTVAYSAKFFERPAEMLNENWICTDDYQWCRRLGETKFWLVEIREDGDGTYFYVSEEIDLSDYSDADMENYVTGYYDSIDEIRTQYPEDMVNQVIAECIFEQTPDFEFIGYGSFASEEAAEVDAICYINDLERSDWFQMLIEKNDLER